MIKILVFIIFIVTAYAFAFNKRYVDSIAPALIIQTDCLFLSGVFLSNVEAGIYLGMVLFGIMLVYRVTAIIQNGTLNIANRLREELKRTFLNNGFFLFLVVFLCIYGLNTGKYLYLQDDYDHWAPFVREILRLNDLFCKSDATFGHKDYLPFISIFEALWVKVSGDTSEASLFRSIQFLWTSMLLPLICLKEEKICKNFFVAILVRSMLLFILPLFFNMTIYHSLDQDYIFGISIFYCVWIILNQVIDHSDTKYFIFHLTIALQLMVFGKQTAIVFLPVILVFCIALGKLSKGLGAKEAIISGIIPFLQWIGYNYVVVPRYMQAKGSQSYGGHSISLVKHILLFDGTVSYQKEVSILYAKALFQKGIFGGWSYVVCMIFAVLSLCVLWKITSNEYLSKIVSITCYWIVIAGLMYALVFYYLYMSAFSEYEARNLASLERYMATYIIATFLIVLALCYFSLDKELLNRFSYMTLCFVLSNYVMTGMKGAGQALPGFIDIPGLVEGDTKHFACEISFIEENTTTDSSIYVLAQGDNGQILSVFKYYLMPRTIGGGSIGRAVSADDVWSIELNNISLAAYFDDYEYLYLLNLDEAFIERYGKVFDKLSMTDSGKLLRIHVENDKIFVLEDLGRP